jgi:hypothetical protein
MLRFLQDHPKALEAVYAAMQKAIRPFKRWLTPDSRLATWLIRGEAIGKGAVFDCQMCGQCILHSTGMTCPMTCPKNLRNGPCGGVRTNGHCEVKPEMRCIWTVAYERSLNMPIYGREFIQIQPPLNQRLQGSSSWVNMLAEIDTITPPGWILPAAVPVQLTSSLKEKADGQ